MANNFFPIKKIFSRGYIEKNTEMQRENFHITHTQDGKTRIECTESRLIYELFTCDLAFEKEIATVESRMALLVNENGDRILETNKTGAIYILEQEKKKRSAQRNTRRSHKSSEHTERPEDTAVSSTTSSSAHIETNDTGSNQDDDRHTQQRNSTRLENKNKKRKTTHSATPSDPIARTAASSNSVEKLVEPIKDNVVTPVHTPVRKTVSNTPRSIAQEYDTDTAAAIEALGDMLDG